MTPRFRRAIVLVALAAMLLAAMVGGLGQLVR
jgi:predicted small secreted protein